jgi:uncharacterized Zn-binding protein involved in type VI secretion
MPGIARVGVDTAGGTLLQGSNSHVYVNGALVEVLGGPVAPHGTGPHSHPTMATASSGVFINGVGVCRAGDSASCGHTATGDSGVFAD